MKRLRAPKDTGKRFDPYWLFGSAFLAAVIIVVSMFIRPLWWFSWNSFGIFDVIVILVLWLLITYAVYRKGLEKGDKY